MKGSMKTLLASWIPEALGSDKAKPARPKIIAIRRKRRKTLLTKGLRPQSGLRASTGGMEVMGRGVDG
jgi:hypothetical protein